jgi:hypothetical protein
MNEASASLLRSALAALARERTTQPSKYVRHRFGDEQRDLGFLTLTSQYDLKHVLRHAMRALLAYPETSAFARWTVYRSSETSLRGEERVYRLKVDYSRARQHRPPSAELWVLVTTERERDLITETAWQGFIRSWLKTTSVRQESLKECWQELWGVLGYAGLPEE